MDKLTPKQRSATMSRVRSADTRPELAIRRVLHRLGFRFRLHVASLPGKPDIVFPTLRKVIFVDGCFWHGHGCRPGSTRPRSNETYWSAKLDRNIARDAANTRALLDSGWDVLRVWECSIPSGDWIPEVMQFLSSIRKATKGATSPR
jgi:DNA mismatch endonuclease (patch repair protein)